MTNQLSVDSVENLPVISHNALPVITTELLAQLYGTDCQRITNNFNRNKGRFTKEKHYYKLINEELRSFKHRNSLRVPVKRRVTGGDSVQNDRVSLKDSVGSHARSLILCTERGAARHAKMLETDQAWDLFEKLEECYFNPQTKAVQPEPKKPVHPCERV